MTDTPAAQSSGIDPETGELAPAFAGQRPPFPPGHRYSLRHGAHSEARLRPLAEKIAAGVVAELGLSDGALEPEVRALLMKYARRRRPACCGTGWTAAVWRPYSPTARLFSAREGPAAM